jgi:hypothetical protein
MPGKRARPVRRGAVGNTGQAVRWPPTLLVLLRQDSEFLGCWCLDY